MLRQLSIKNFALIQDIDVHFDSGLNIITGETGAGKSMLIGALGLILGNRADLLIIGKNGDRCIVEGHFDIKGLNLDAFFSDNDLDYSDETVVRRELNQAGKSRSFINDTPVNLQQLKDLASNLVSFHSQHESLSLGNTDFQFMVLDSYAGNASDLIKFQNDRYKLLKLAQEIHQTEDELNRQISDNDYHRFLFDELSTAALIEGEDQTLDAEQNRLSNAGALQEGLSRALELLETDERGLLDQLRKLSATLESLKKIDIDIHPIAEAIQIHLSDFKQYAREVSRMTEDIAMDDVRLAEVNERLQQIHNLCRKHKVTNLSELLVVRDEIGKKLNSLENLDETLSLMRDRYKADLTALGNQAKFLSKKRHDSIPELEKQINGMFAQVGMPHALLRVDLIDLPEDEFNNFGQQNLRFLFAPNPGSDFLPLEKIASGGELSRIMLVVKSLIAGVQQLPTLIFDEIDSGISGETALRVGRVMHSLGRNHQLICITHLPQIACYADTQFHISKKVENGGTQTYMHRLSQEHRETELARMLAGDGFSEKAIDSARELMALAQ